MNLTFKGSKEKLRQKIHMTNQIYVEIHTVLNASKKPN